ncbi:MAG: excisionase family DNA-binding protein [Planctomycetaceae bacterium]|nr:excisionase family DNA-binding protein [Planctomycetaceae bacterium]
MESKTRLLTETGLSSRLNLSRRDVQAMVERNEIPFIRLPTGDIRFDEQAVQRWIEDLQAGR